MNRTIWSSLVCLIAVLVVVGPARADEKDEWKKLVGVWKVEKAIFQGGDATNAFKSAVLTISEGKYKVEFAGQVDEGTLKLDAAKKPKQMSVTGTEGPNKGKTVPTIYEADGNTLKVCYALDEKDPPAAFESKEGTMTLLVTYRREKK